jgi:bla regulator protein BlaR1
MAFLIITSPAADRFIGALCNTLVHSLWQGLILAAVTGLIILLTRKSAPAMRYNLLISALALFAIGVGATFAVQFAQASALSAGAVSMISDAVVNTAAIHINTPISPQNFTETLFSYLNQHHNTIVMVWFMIICAKSIQLVVGLLGVRRLKYTKVHQVKIEWHNRMLQLADNLKIKQRIALLESGLAKVPMVIGTFKPVILIPIGLLTALSTQEVEAILVHELAHIKRRDYLVNLLQSLMEIVFFFNPAVLWISQLIKAERENCCDDMALTQSGNKISYIKALVSCQEYQASVPAYAMAFAGDKNTLMSRVKRMASNKNHSLNLFEKTVLAVCLVVSGLCMSAFAKKAQAKYIADKVVEVINNIQEQNTEQTEEQTSVDSTENKAAQDSIASEATDQSGLAATNGSVNETGNPDSVKRVNLNIKLDSMTIHLAPMIYNPKFKISLDSMKMHMAPLHINLDSMKINKKLNVNLDTSKTNYNTQTSFNTNYNATGRNLNYNTRNKIAYNTPTNKQYTRVLVSPVPDTIKTKIKVERKFDITDALYDAHLIRDKKNYKVVLNNKEMFVNGVKQPESIRQTFLKYYTKNPGDNVAIAITVTNSN